MSRPESSDFALLQAWRQGDRTAGDELVRRYYRRVLRFFEIKVPYVAEDMTQRTFLACVEGQEQFREDGSFKAYLFGIVRFQLLQHLRNKERFDRMAQFKAAGGEATAASPSTIVAKRQEQRLLLRALDALPTDLQLAVQMYYWENLRAAEIGGVLNIPASTVTTRMARARALLRKHVVEMTSPGQVRDDLVDNLERWTRSLSDDAGGPGASTSPADG